MTRKICTLAVAVMLLMTAFGSMSAQAQGDDLPPMILADFFYTDADTDRVEGDLEAALREAGANVIRVEETITDRSQATDAAEANDAVMVIWGESGGGTTSYRYDVIHAGRRDQTSGLENSRFSLTDDEDMQVAVDYAMAQYLYITGDYDAALEAINRALEVLPEGADATALRFRGHMNLAKGEVNAADDDFTAAIEANPDYKEVWVDRGDIADELGDPIRAIEDYTRAIELDPDYLLPIVNRGVVNLEQEYFGDALEDFQRAVELSPQNLRAIYGQGQVHQGLGDLELAIEFYNQALELEPDHRGARNLRGIAYNDLGEFENAIADFDHVLELDSNNRRAYLQRGAAYVGLGDFESAIDDFTAAIDLAPNAANGYRARADAYYRMGDFDAALDDYDRFEDAGGRMDDRIQERIAEMEG